MTSDAYRFAPMFRRAAALLLAVALGGCADSAFGGLTERLTAADGASRTASPDGPGLRLWLGDSPRGIADLMQENGERRLWRTPTGLVVATDGARVVATAGLSQMLTGTRVDGPDPLADPSSLVERPAAARRLVDLMRADRNPANMRFGVTVECRLAARPLPDDQALLVEEHCRGNGIGRFVNRFWVDPASETVFRSEQWIGPGIAMLRVEPVAPDAAAATPVVNRAN